MFTASSLSDALTGEEGGTVSSSGLSMGTEGDDDEARSSAVSVSRLTEPQTSSSMIGADIQRKEDPDVELGSLDMG